MVTRISFWRCGRGDGSTATSDEDYEWTDETNPPTPVDSIEQQKDFREKVIGIKRVMVSNIMLMIPRIEWAENRLFNVIDDTAVSGKRATDYFCINSENNVYQCMKTPGTLTKVGSEPQGFGALIDDEEDEFFRYARHCQNCRWLCLAFPLQCHRPYGEWWYAPRKLDACCLQ